MKRLRVAPLLALALTAACGDDPTGPRLAASVEVLSRSQHADETTIAAGDTLRLSASARDASGREMAGRPIRWSSDDPAVATVDDSGLVRGIGIGRARITAASDTASHTMRINVAAPVTGSIECAPGQSPLDLEVGGMRATTGWETGTLCFGGGPEGAEYMLISHHASRGAGALPVILEASAALEAGPSSSRSVYYPAPLGGAPLRDDAFHLRLRERALPGLTRRAGTAAPGDALLPSLSRAAAMPGLGDLLRLNVETASADGCSSPDYRTGRVVAVTQRAIVVADTANPSGGFSAEEYRGFGAAFDELVYPLGVENFGEPSDLDRNGRAIIFFTAAVNELTRLGSGSYIGGFFYDRDLFPASGSGACDGSNAAEMFYMMVPDPVRSASGEPAFSKASVAGHTVAVIGHEFQHLINASRRLHVQDAPRWEETWLNEGLSHIAEELLFYRVSGLSPRANLDGSGMTPDQWRALQDYQLQNFERHVRFLRSPQNTSAITGEDLAMRGAAWGFLRYAADRRGGSERDLWYRLANSSTSGVDNLREVLGVDPLEWVHDWTLALYLDDAGLSAAAKHQQPSWNLRELFPRLRDRTAGTVPGAYPLRILQFQHDRVLGLNLPGGASGYVRIPVSAGSTVAVRLTSGGLPAPEKLRLTAIRTR